MEEKYINSDELLAMSWKEQVMYLAANNAEDRFIRALIRTRPETDWSQLKNEDTPQSVRQAISTLYWEQNAFTHHREIKEQPKYRPVDEVLQDFFGNGKRQDARKELQVRLRYLTAHEQKQVLYAFMDSNAKIDRVFACKYLDKYYDPMYHKAVETIWELHHEFEAAKVLTHYATDDFIAAHFDALIEDYRYLPVRLRMPADYPVERFRLSWHEYIYLCARQHLPITKAQAFAILCNTLHLQLIRKNVAFDGGSLFRLSYIITILWSLGELGFHDIILRFYVENERTKHLFHQGENDDVRNAVIAQLEKDGFVACHDILNPDKGAYVPEN